MKKRALLSGLLLLFATGAFGQAYDMTVHLSTGESVAIPLDDILKIEFTGVPSAGPDPGSAIAGTTPILFLQSYPNPAHRSAMIEYELKGEADVSVRVFNLQGALIRELVRDTQTAGRHAVSWDGAGATGEPVSSGVYFSVVECGGQSVAHRLIVVR